MKRHHDLSDGSDANEKTGITRDSSGSTSHDEKTGITRDASRDSSHDENFSLGDIAKSIGDVLRRPVFGSAKKAPEKTADEAAQESPQAMSDSASSVNDALGGVAANQIPVASEPTSGTSIDTNAADGSGGINTGAVASDDDFVGSGGIGSAEYMEALHKGHQEAGGDYASDLSNPNDSADATPDTDGAQGRT